ncbi:MAG: hypothetical protein LBH31_04405 [Burkholderiaceae bacterium]|jgi:hypothetical protein|nr:hypothetical protein [Burkholderiaceae bacterium]
MTQNTMVNNQATHVTTRLTGPTALFAVLPAATAVPGRAAALTPASGGGSRPGAGGAQLQISLDNGLTWQNVAAAATDGSAWSHASHTPLVTGAHNVLARVVAVASQPAPEPVRAAAVHQARQHILRRVFLIPSVPLAGNRGLLFQH